MAKQVKVFNGTVGVSTAIYSVPSGRVARVEVVSLTCGSNTGKIVIYAGGILMFDSKGESPFFIPYVGVGNPSITGSDTTLVGEGSVGTGILARRYAYLTAGQTISINIQSSGSLSYNFCVVEEY